MNDHHKSLWEVKSHWYSKVDALEERLGYVFIRKEWLYEALTHRSALVSEGLDETTFLEDRPWNERLEFLGDSVLGLTMSDYLCSHARTLSEGEMSRIRASLVCEESLAALARGNLQLGEYLILGQSELRNAGRDKTSILADALEAVIGAVYSDGGWEAAKALVLKLYAEPLAQNLEFCLERDHKTVFQEVAQARFRSTPTYDVLSEIGPPHSRLFEVAVFLDRDSHREEWGRGSGTTKKRAAQAAASQALKRWKESHS